MNTNRHESSPVGQSCRFALISRDDERSKVGASGPANRSVAAPVPTEEWALPQQRPTPVGHRCRDALMEAVPFVSIREIRVSLELTFSPSTTKTSCKQ